VPTANEKKALWFLAIVAISGSVVRLWRAKLPDATATESAALERQIGRVDSVRAVRHTKGNAASKAERLRPTSHADTAAPNPEPKGLVDLDQATLEQIESLPGIGPSLAKRIVADRDSSGSFGQIEAVCEVHGIGPALAERLRPLVTFTGPRRPLSAACGDASNKARKTRGTHTRQPR
jgi:competence protein ComEA